MVTGSCGHQLTDIEDMGIGIAVKDYFKDGGKAVCYMSVCTKCAEFYEKSGLILKTEQSQNDWLGLNSKKWTQKKK